MEPVDILIIQVYMPTSEYEDDEVEKVTQTASYWETGIALLEMNHIRTLLDHMD
jgi:hypothetical protein